MALDAPPGGGSASPNTAEAPPTIGLDSLLLEEAFERAASLPRLYSLLVARHGEMIREEYFNGTPPGRVANIKSASKSVISTLVGIAIDQGHLEGVDQPIAPFFPEWSSQNGDPRIHEITIEHLLAMQSGLQSTSFGNYGAWAASSNWVRDQLTRPFVDEPGGAMVYSTGSTHLLSAILTQATGRSTLAYARDVLFAPMGISLSPWTRDPQGIYMGGNEMGLRPQEMLTYGELYRRGGVHEGERLLSEAWIERSWIQRGTSSFNGHGYGLGWWIRDRRGYDVYFAWGYGGQYVFVVPELEMTVVTTSNPTGPRAGGHTRTIHDMVTDLLIPAAEQGAG
ncbi:MAG: class C beta-lactamase-related serine hydrolase [Gemmatimonadales bacterium]|nr:MAG: class C beta-lactamase-related serine hydrolase [Gemmatimonadales bacterium]